MDRPQQRLREPHDPCSSMSGEANNRCAEASQHSSRCEVRSRASNNNGSWNNEYIGGPAIVFAPHGAGHSTPAACSRIFGDKWRRRSWPRRFTPTSPTPENRVAASHRWASQGMAAVTHSHGSRRGDIAFPALSLWSDNPVEASQVALPRHKSLLPPPPEPRVGKPHLLPECPTLDLHDARFAPRCFLR